MLIIFLSLIMIIFLSLIMINTVTCTKFFNNISKNPIISTNDIGHRLLPVLHNVKPENAKSLANQLSSMGLQSCTISLRHPNAIEALDIFIKNSNNIIVGASTIVSTKQIKDVKQCGAKFVSTMFPSYDLIKTSRNNDISILCGVVTYRDSKNALEWGANGLKFYPASQVSPDKFMKIKQQINDEGININDISCYIAGGITNHQYDSYLQASIDGFAIGIDCDIDNNVADSILSKQSNINKIINEYNQHILTCL